MNWFIDPATWEEIDAICERCQTDLYQIRCKTGERLNRRAARTAIIEYLHRMDWEPEDIADFLFTNDRLVEAVIERFEKEKNTGILGKVLKFMGGKK
jgi:hypothetical protein